jgi:fructokinase
VIVVAGEALVDLVVSRGGQVDARLGGAAYNAARALARLGVKAALLERLSGDTLGRRLHDQLTEENVALCVPEPSAKPCTLAVATLDTAGAASYSFYLDATAGPDVDYETAKKAFPADAAAVHVGALGLVMEPFGAAIERLVLTDVPADALVMLDPNCRPGAVADPAPYRTRISAIARRADIVKASTEDLAYLYPGLQPEAAAKLLREAGAPLVLVTDGPRPARAFLEDTVLTEDAPAVTVVDTIGAGDAFGGGFLAWWTAHGLGRADLRRGDLVSQALRAATAAAALTCTRPGADPPTLAELQARNWWP